MVLVMLTHHGAHGKLKLFHLEDGGFNHQRDYKKSLFFSKRTCILEKVINLNLQKIRSLHGLLEYLDVQYIYLQSEHHNRFRIPSS
ncbi:MAG: hypothetical protein O7C58_07770 [Rickettsia endosymbiont of Ixodes persulcatus]|nr:hypothetical protein [Rickettsia endosymbiont of Ixodes persulcatus]MCZ6926065.1 hypothetical protein [Rickettsia endosymbiont of Ixodes persulcatus]